MPPASSATSAWRHKSPLRSRAASPRGDLRGRSIPAPTDRSTQPVSDLEQRVHHALDLAARVVEAFADTGFVDVVATYNSFGPEKVVAETAMLLHAASGVRERPAVRDRFDELAGIRRRFREFFSL